VWITETGWPTAGQNSGNAVSSVANAQAFWKAVACPAFPKMDVWWYAYQDWNDNPSFGLIGKDFKPMYDLSC
jgi:glucan endo-1,3-beta-D-glucosidase